MASKSSKKKASGGAPTLPPVHTAVTAAMLAFANPPQSENAAKVAEGCAKTGFATIGIAIHGPGDVIDFGRFDTQSCVDLANAIEICVGGQGFEVPSLAGALDVLRERGTQMTFANFVKALTSVMKPKVP